MDKIADFRLREVPLVKQNHKRRFTYKEADTNRHFIGVDTETTTELGQEAKSLQIAIYKGNKKFETLFIENKCKKGFEERGTLKIQGYTLDNTILKIPAKNWNGVINRFLWDDNKNTMSFFNILFDIPLIFNLKESTRRPNFWIFNTDLNNETKQKYQTVMLKKLRGMRTLIEERNFQFMDTQTLSNVLYNEFSLAGAADRILGLKKLHDDNYGMEYAVWDACLTSLLAYRLNKDLTEIANIRADNIRTAGTFSKYLLGAMGFKRPRFENHDIKPFWQAYYGARIESSPLSTKEALQGDYIYADIKGQYANAMAKLDAFKYLGCERLEIDKIDPTPDLLNPDPINAMIAVKLKSKNAPLPVRTDDLNLMADVTGEGIYMLADVWSANLLDTDNRAEIEILEAWQPIPLGLQKLKSVHGINPLKTAEDLIRLRAESTTEHRAKFYKNVLNTIYGITTEGRSNEKSLGVYTNPVVSAAITSLARYWVALMEYFINKQGSHVHYIATDSAFIKAEYYEPLKEFMAKNKVQIDVKGRGKALLTIAANKYALYSNKTGTRIAKDANGHYLISEHGLNQSYQLPGKKRFYNLLLENYKKAFECYKEGANPMKWEGFTGLDQIMVTSHTITSPLHLEQVKRAFKAYEIPQAPRCGMFYYSIYDPVGDLDESTTPGILPTKELAFEAGQMMGARKLDAMIRKHFNHTDDKFNYPERARWKINLDEHTKRIKARYRYKD